MAMTGLSFSKLFWDFLVTKYIISDALGSSKCCRDLKAFFSQIKGRKHYLDSKNSVRASKRAVQESLSDYLVAHVYEEDSCQWRYEIRLEKR